MGGNPFVFMIEQVQYTVEVAGITHIHGVGDGGGRGSWPEFPGDQVDRNNIVNVVGREECMNGQSHLPGDESGCHVSVISTGN